MRNYPPPHGIRVPAEAMRRLVVEIFAKAGTSRRDGEFMADLLVRNDLRCVFSHGTRKAADYVHMMLEGRVNPRPEVRVIHESGTSLVVDGDGGMGHFPCYCAAQRAIAKAGEHGVGMATTRNHFNLGAAGHYARLALEHDCIGVVISSHRYPLDPGDTVLSAAAASPMSIAVPAGAQPPLVLDMHSRMVPDDLIFFGRFPSAYFKTLGLGAVFQALGGILAGIWKPEIQGASREETERDAFMSHEAYLVHGAFIAVFDPSRFMPVEEFKEEMDRFIGRARRMKPFPGLERAELPGGMEWQWERENERQGIPISPEHREILEAIAAELGVEVPFAPCAPTRF